MATSSWTNATSGDWNVATNWTGGTPNSATADAVINATPATAPYTVTIAAGASDTVNSIAMNSTVDVNKSPYIGGMLEIDGTLTFAPGSDGALDGPLQNVVLMNDGKIVNGGTLNAFIQAGGISSFTGTNAIYFTNWLQSIGTTTIDTTSIGEYTPATKTLFDGIFEAKGDGAVVNLGGPTGKNIVNIGTIVGPKPTVTPNFWTEVIMDGPTSAINEWNGTAYVPLESSLTTIGGSGIVSLSGNRSYTTTNTLTIQKDGMFAQASGTLTTGGVTIEAGGKLTDGVPQFFTSPGAVAPGADNAMLTVAGDVLNDGTIEALPAGILLQGHVSGTGTMNFGQGGGTIEIAGTVDAGQNVVLSGGDTLVIDSPGAFKGSISDTGGANTIVLKGVTATQAVASGDSLVISNGGTTVASIATSGTLAAATVATADGNATIQLGGPAGPTFLASSTASTTTSTATAALKDLASLLPSAAVLPPIPPLPPAPSAAPDIPAFTNQLFDVNAGGVLPLPPDHLGLG